MTGSCGAVLLLFSASSLFASASAAWEMTSFQDFIKGKFQGVSVGRDGRLTLAPKLDTVFSSEQPVIWSLAQGPDGSLYAGTGHRGKLFRVDPAGKSSLLWTSEQPEIFAIAVDANGVVYAATSPDGKVYRVENGKAQEYFAPKAKYIWSLAFGRDGALYAGTGDEGKIFRVTAPAKGEEYYATGQGNVTSLSIDTQGRLLAGTEPNGILYRISAKDKAFVLYDANLPEIRAIAGEPDGTIYAVALGGSVAKRAQSAAQAAQAAAGAGTVPTVTTSITVTAESAQAGPEIKATPDVAKAPQAVATTTTTAAAQTIDLTGVEKSALYKIHPDNTVETLWSSKEENVYDMLAMPGQILFSTDANGRIYRLSPDRKLTLVAQTNDSEATRLLSSGKSVLAATGNMGRIYRLDAGAGASGTYESPVFDAQNIARWGRLSWRGSSGGGTIALHTRSGNSLRPDSTWSDWSAPLSTAAGGQIDSPNARYIQWKSDLAGGQPVIESVSVAYLPQNSAPTVKSITVVTQLSAVAPPKAASSAASSAYSITVTDTGDAGPSSSTGTPTQTLSRAASQQVVISWLAEDPDGDRLAYSLYFRGEGEREWKPLKSNMHENSATIEGDALADGRYFFRVVASDREVNPPATAREADLVSSPVLIDNTPPVVTVGVVRKSGAAVDVDFEGRDAASALRRCEYALDAGAWTPLNSLDGVIDSRVERFHLHLDTVPPGEHVLVLRVVDSGNNAGLAKVIL
ncbi:MAG: hypothetical protein M3Y07_05570 [Acidobacteriota bacterium]|nr:hypothetical protein [Acidobacteriota bacterium]